MNVTRRSYRSQTNLQRSLLQPERRLPAPTTFPSSPSEVRHVISGWKPIVTDDPAENPLQWLHQFATPIQSKPMMAEPGQEGKRTHKEPLSSKLGLREQAGFGPAQPLHQRLSRLTETMTQGNEYKERNWHGIGRQFFAGYPNPPTELQRLQRLTLRAAVPSVRHEAVGRQRRVNSSKLRQQRFFRNQDALTVCQVTSSSATRYQSTCQAKIAPGLACWRRNTTIRA